jgi:hypothetical protein
VSEPIQKPNFVGRTLLPFDHASELTPCENQEITSSTDNVSKEPTGPWELPFRIVHLTDDVAESHSVGLSDAGNEADGEEEDCRRYLFIPQLLYTLYVYYT